MQQRECFLFWLVFVIIGLLSALNGWVFASLEVPLYSQLNFELDKILTSKPVKTDIKIQQAWKHLKPLDHKLFLRHKVDNLPFAYIWDDATITTWSDKGCFNTGMTKHGKKHGIVRSQSNLSLIEASYHDNVKHGLYR